MALTVQSSLGHVSSTVLDPSNRWYACSSGRIPPKKSCMVYASTQIGGNHGWNSWNSSHRGPSELSWRLSFESDEWDSVLSKKRHKWAVHNMTPGRAKAKHEAEPLKVMIAGAPASGKGTQCELISKKYGLTHIATGDLLRAEVAAGTEYGKKAKEYMDQGKLVPDEVVVTMVTQKLAQSHAKKKGWLLDGYPRSLSQAEALQALGIKPSIFILLEVSGQFTLCSFHRPSFVYKCMQKTWNPYSRSTRTSSKKWMVMPIKMQFLLRLSKSWKTLKFFFLESMLW
ncbi:hypothetical protein O6H91_09G092600 [Diphasiastrum complanatum]|uniref:Uncharacterized protein n=1 Tax=Diphasiastrum complanatum TaxID=34168 RepID=A0ACC2CRU0_DIPCM|nr:hypothetical protein O6H91_09G092600 [Diphasiastrum complanatum]